MDKPEIKGRHLPPNSRFSDRPDTFRALETAAIPAFITQVDATTLFSPAFDGTF
jgi:hypothetical protein